MKAIIVLIAVAGVAATTLAQPAPTTAPVSATVKNEPAKDGSAPKSPLPAAPKPQARAPASQPARPQRSIVALLDSRVPEVNFDKTPFEKVMEWVQDYTGALVCVRWRALEDAAVYPETPITLKARDKKLTDILWAIMNQVTAASGVTLAYEASADLFLFSTHRDLSSKMVTKVYDLTDLTIGILQARLADFNSFDPSKARPYRTYIHRPPPPPPLTTQTSSGEVITLSRGPRAEITTDDEQLQELMELIQNTIAPDSWDVYGGDGMIFPRPGQGKLVIRNSLYVHQMIGGAVRSK